MYFILRSWTPDYPDSLRKQADHFGIARFMTDVFPHPYTMERGKAFIEMATSEAPLRIKAIDVNGLAVGSTGIHPQTDIMRKNTEIGYWIGQDCRRQGIVTEAVKQMVSYGFKYFGIDRIFARVFETNTASQRVMKKAGFVLQARFNKTIFKNGEYLDELIYAVRRES